MKLSRQKTFKVGGVHPPEAKLTSGMPIKDISLPRRATFYLGQSIGKPAEPIVAVGDHVERGQMIAKAQGAISANLHTSITGTVKAIGDVRNSEGHPVRAIVVEATEDDHLNDLELVSDAHPLMSDEAALKLPAEQIRATVAQAGIVGMGGAAFPTAVKLSVGEQKEPPTLLINGSECEPYLTADEAIMREQPAEIALGAMLILRAIGGNRAIIGIEDNKPEAIEAMKRAAHPYPALEVVALRTRYPQGGEKMLIKALTGKEVAPGALPITAGAVVQNTATALAVYHAVVWGIPLIERVVTISGADFQARGNYRIAVGSDLKEVVDSLGGIPQSTTEIIVGGTMMGRGLGALMGATTKSMNGLLMLSATETKQVEPSPCVRCGRCVDSCPMGLQPYLLARLVETNAIEQAVDEGLLNCMECGCCAYSCIASRRLVDAIKVGKMISRENAQKRNSANGK